MTNATAGGALEVVRRINEAWMGREPDAAAPHIHPEMVVVDADFRPSGRGREACVQGYRAFCERAEVLDYGESEHSESVTGCTAVVSYRFRITYAIGEKVYRESGRDLLVLTRDGGRWLAAWRTLLPESC